MEWNAYISLDNGSFHVKLDPTGDILEQIKQGIKEHHPKFDECSRCGTFTKFLADISEVCKMCDPGTMLCDDCTNSHTGEANQV